MATPHRLEAEILPREPPARWSLCAVSSSDLRFVSGADFLARQGRHSRKPRPRTDDRKGCPVRATSRGEKELSLQTKTTVETEVSEGFLTLGLSETMLRALERAGFHEPSPIQDQM